MVIRVKIFQTELIVEICSESLVRAIGKVLLIKFSWNTNYHKGDEKWPLFVNKQLFWWSTSITLDNNNAVLNTLPHTSVSLTSCIYIVFSVLNILTHMATMLRVGSL